MFRKGGSANEGIMTGLVDRKGYSTGTSWEDVIAKNPSIGKYYDAMSAIEQPRDTSLSQMLIQGGLNLVSGEGAGGGTLSNIAKSYKGPSEQFMQSQMLRQQRDAKMKEAAVQAGLGEDFAMKQALAKRKTDVSKIQSIANELQKHNPLEYPDTPEGRAAAWNKAFEASETSPAPHPQTRYDKLWTSLASGQLIDEQVAKNIAGWEVYISENVFKDKNEEGETKFAGEVPTFYSKKDKKDYLDVDAMEPGKIYWDKEDGELKEVIMEDGIKIDRIVPGWRQKYDSRYMQESKWPNLL